MNFRLLFLLLGFYFPPMAGASLYEYPEDKRPAVSLGEACGIGEKLLAGLGFGDAYYVFSVSLYGDEEATGDGTWNLIYRNAKGDRIQIGIYFPEDFCLVITIPAKGKSAEKGYTRDGKVAAKWLEWEEDLRKQREEAERIFGKFPGAPEKPDRK